MTCESSLWDLVILLVLAKLSFDYELNEDAFYKTPLKLNNETDASWFRSQWLQPSVRETMEVNLFEQLSDSLEPRQAARVGPFKFTVNQRKDVIEETRDRITYEPIIEYTRDYMGPDKDDLSQVIKMPNVLLFAAKRVMASHSFDSDVRDRFQEILKTTKPVIQHRIDEFTFNGYNDSLVAFINQLQEMKLITDQVLTDGKFPLMYNNTNSQGEITVSKGADNIKQSGQLIAWNARTETDLYGPGRGCNKIHGSTGINFGAFIYETDMLYTFIPEFCLAVPFKFTRNTETFGVKTRRFEFDFYDRELEPCYVHDGIHDVSKCSHQAPIVLSAPCYNSTNGTDCSDRMSFLEVDPTTGITLRSSFKFQMNLLVDKSIINASRVPPSTLIVPLMQIERNMELLPAAIDNIKGLSRKHLIILWVFAILIAVACLITCFPLIKLFYRLCKLCCSRDDDSDSDEESLVSSE